MSDIEIEQADSGASNSYPVQCSSLRKGGHVLIKNKPCKIVEMSTSKTGKHGHAKVHMVALDIFDGRKYEDICPSTHNMNVPNVNRKMYTLLDIDDDYLQLMDDEGNQKEDLKCCGDVGENIKKLFDEGKELTVTVLTSMGQEKVASCKVTAN